MSLMLMRMDAARTATAGVGRLQPADQPEVTFAALDETPAHAGVAAERPRWFQKRAGTGRPAKTPAAGTPPRRQVRLETSETDEEPGPWQNRVKAWILGTAGLSYGISIAFHTVLLIVLALVVYHTLPDDERGTLMVDTREDDEISLSEVDTRIDLPMAQEDLAPPQLQAVPLPDVDSDLELQASLDDVLPSPGAVGEGTAGGTGLALPRGDNAVTAGSFTAWTIPEDPEPAKDYAIVIEIKIPDRIKTYRLVDLSGVVIGTDLYSQQIPYDPRNPSSTATVRDGKPVTLRDNRAQVPIVDGRVQLIIRVPGAAELVKDRIKVRSRLLKEEQDLEIQF